MRYIPTDPEKAIMLELQKLSLQDMPWRFGHLPPSAGQMRFEAKPDGARSGEQNDLRLDLLSAQHWNGILKSIEPVDANRVQVSFDSITFFILETAPSAVE